MSAISRARKLTGKSRPKRTLGSVMAQGSNVSVSQGHPGRGMGSRMKQSSFTKSHQAPKTMGKRMGQ